MKVRRWMRLRTRGRRARRAELEEEIRAHLEMRTEALIRRGETPERARELARRRFGDSEEAMRILRDSARSRDGRLWWASVSDEVRRSLLLTWRQARKSPGFTALTVLTFALGIGLTALVYAFVDGVLLRPLPYPHPEGLVMLESVDSAGRPVAAVSSANWQDWMAATRTIRGSALVSFATWDTRTVRVGDGAASNATAVSVTPGYFDILGIPMLRGRGLAASDLDGTAQHAVVVSEGFWRGALGSGPIPSEIQLSGHPIAVVGVVPDDMVYPEGVAVWMPAILETAYGYRRSPAARNWMNWTAVARLATGATRAQAEAELGAVARRIRERDPVAAFSFGVHVAGLKDTIVGDASRTLPLLLGAVLLVLLLACANLAGLNFARGMARRTELAVQLSLGSTRARLVGQLVVGNVVLALAGGLFGLVLAALALRALTALLADQLPRLGAVGIHSGTLSVVLLVSVLAGLLSGLTPALRISGRSLAPTLSGARGVVRGGRLPGASILAFEVALALVLVTGSALLVRSFRTIVSQDLGFDTDGVVTADVALSGERYASPDAVWAYWSDLRQRVGQLPGVEAVALAGGAPLAAAGSGYIETDGAALARASAGYRVASEGFFAAMGMQLLRGRDLDARDDAASDRVVVINRRMADRYWPGQDPIGRTVRAVSMEGGSSGDAPPLRVVGVVNDILHWGYEVEGSPEMYVAYRQVPDRARALTLIVRARPERASRLVPEITRVIQSTDPDIAPDVQLMRDQLARTLSYRTTILSVMSAFGALSLIITAVGIFCLLSFAVAQRRREIGIRAALGARRQGILGMVLRDAFRVVGIGAVAGILAASWLSRLLAGFLYGVTTHDASSYGGAALVLAITVAAAAVLPAWRAATVDPLEALRIE